MYFEKQSNLHGESFSFKVVAILAPLWMVIEAQNQESWYCKQQSDLCTLY
jgi:hypothetical protein